MSERAIRLCSLRAADSGARLIMNIEITADTGVEKIMLSPMVSRLEGTPVPGPLTEQEFSFYQEESAFADALARGYRYLSAADLSPATVQKRLLAAGISQMTARHVVEQLISTGMLDEPKSARREAERDLAKLWGDRRIFAALRAKGYSKAALAEVVGFLSEQDSAARCAALIEKRRMALPRDERGAARFVASLTRYGYTGSEIRAALALLRARNKA